MAADADGAELGKLPAMLGAHPPAPPAHPPAPPPPAILPAPMLQGKHRLRHMRLSEELSDDEQASSDSGRRKKKRISVSLQSRGASIASSVANLANTNMGVGMLALPSAFAAAGWLGGALMLLLSASIATFGSHLLAECVERVGRPAALPKVTEVALGRVGILMTNISVIIIGASCAIGYLIVVGDTLPEIYRFLRGGEEGEPASIFDARQFWIVAALLIIVPLALLRKIDSLRFASLLVVGCVGIIVATVLLFALQPADIFDPCGSYAEHDEDSAAGEPGASCRGRVDAMRNAQHTLSALPTCLFAFAAQINVPSIVSELHQPTNARVWKTLLGGRQKAAILAPPHLPFRCRVSCPL